MNLTTELKGKTAVVSIIGDLDASTASEAADYLRLTLEEGYPVVIIDLGQVPFMSSAGLRFLLDTHQQSKVAGSQIVLAAAQIGVERVLTTSGFTRILTSYPTVDEALKENHKKD